MSDERQRQAFEAAYRAHYWHIVAYAARRLGSGAGDDAARDAAQEAFAVAWRRRADLPAAPLPWLYGVAANVVRNAERGDRRRERLTARLHAVPDAPGAEGSPLDPPTLPTGCADPVLRALAGLSEADREVLRLAAWEDLGATEIAQILGCSSNTAAARLSRAKKRLRAAVDSAAAPIARGTPARPRAVALDAPDNQEVRRA